MATSPLKLQQAYGIGQALQNLPPFTIVANRAPTTADKAKLGTLWNYASLNQAYMLTSVTGGASNWTLLSNNGGAGVFTSLTVNGASILTGSLTQTAGNVTLGADAAAQTISIGTGAAAKTVTLGSTNTTSTTTINAGSGNINLNGSTVISKAGLVLQTNCTAGGAASVQSIQTSDDNAGVLYATFKRYSTGTITVNDQLYLQVITGQQGGADRTAAFIQSTARTVGAGFVSGDFNFDTTNSAGVQGSRLRITPDGQLNINTAGQTLGIKQGANAMAGTVVLDGATGSFTQANTQVTNAGSIILLSRVNVNGASGAALTYTIVDNTSFTVTARDATTGLAVNTDASTIAYMIVQLVP